MKSSFSLFELILTLVISTTVIIYSTLIIKDLSILNKNSLSQEINRLELNSTKLFIEKNKNKLNQINFSNNTLYFKSAVLLKNVDEFNIIIEGNLITVNVSLKNSFKQIWKIAI